MSVNFMKEFIRHLNGRSKADVQTMFQEGGCAPSTKARYWSGSLWQAFKRPKRQK